MKANEHVSQYTMTKKEFEIRKRLLTARGRRELRLKEEVPAPTGRSDADFEARVKKGNEIFAWLREQTPNYTEDMKLPQIQSEYELSLMPEQMHHVTRFCYCTVDGLMIYVERSDEVTRNPWTLTLSNGEEYRNYNFGVEGDWDQGSGCMEFADHNEACHLAQALAGADMEDAGTVFLLWETGKPGGERQ